MKKDTLWYELLDCTHNDECPICALISKRINQTIKAFLYENVNDPEIRGSIHRSHGFCNYHSRMLQNYGDPLAHALIYEDIFRDILNETAYSSSKLINFCNHEECFFCKMEKDCEKTYTDAFLQGFSQPEFKQVYEKEGMLCIPHLTEIMQISKHQKKPSEIQNEILTLTRLKYEQLLKNLSGIKQKCDYRHNTEPWSPKEKNAWKLAANTINDICGLRK